MPLSELVAEIADAPLYLSWMRQGKVRWEEYWLESNGPVRQSIPSLDDHISFANFDLRQNSLAQIETNSMGKPFVSCITALTQSEFRALFMRVAAISQSNEELRSFIQEHVYARLVALRSILNIVKFHGFDPETRTEGLDQLKDLTLANQLRQSGYFRAEF